MPYREYLCDYCGHIFEELTYAKDPEDYRQTKCRCGSQAEILPSSISAVTGVSLSSARPKGRVSKPAFRGHPGNQGEPDNKRLEFDYEDKEYD